MSGSSGVRRLQKSMEESKPMPQTSIAEKINFGGKYSDKKKKKK
jgi:hypothetical protein